MLYLNCQLTCLVLTNNLNDSEYLLARVNIHDADILNFLSMSFFVKIAKMEVKKN
jgi:hypothetical protein